MTHTLEQQDWNTGVDALTRAVQSAYFEAHKLTMIRGASLEQQETVARIRDQLVEVNSLIQKPRHSLVLGESG